MADILQDFPIHAAPSRVFEAVSAPGQLDQWWTLRSSGQPAMGSIYELDFGPAFQWQAVVTKSVPGSAFELALTRADDDWIGSTVSFELSPSGSGTQGALCASRLAAGQRSLPHVVPLLGAVPQNPERRHFEHGESVPYDRRLDV